MRTVDVVISLRDLAYNKKTFPTVKSLWFASHVCDGIVKQRVLVLAFIR